MEIFAWGKYGGFGRATRLIGRELARRGVTVTAIVPQRAGQRPVEDLDGIKVFAFRVSDLGKISRLAQSINADIYHSMEPSLTTYLAMRSMPDHKHLITFRDTRNIADWLIELRYPSANALQVLANWLYEDNFLVHQAVRRADGHYAATKLLIPKARKKYHLPRDPQFLPTPVVVSVPVEKSSTPTVCFVGRWDKRKRPELFFELAKTFPEVRFIAAGRSRDPGYEKRLRTQYAGLKNLEFAGFLDQFQADKLSHLYGKCWVMVNTAAREALPNTFFEAAAHGCAILSAVDPDGFASSFGWHVQHDQFTEGLATLLQNNLWRDRGEAGRQYVLDTFAVDRAIDKHLVIYKQILGESQQ